MAYTANMVTKVAKNEIGYIEKASNNYLAFKTKNPGSANWTKYNKYFGYANVYWCANFFSWIFAKAFGKEEGKHILCGGYSASCDVLLNQFLNRGRFSKEPKVGDAIFFSGTRHTGANHIGYVYRVTSSMVYTIEGNAGSGSSVTDNGGMVVFKSYSRTYNRIIGYGHPMYSTTETVQTGTSLNKKSSVAMPTLKHGNVGVGVKTLQKNLNKVMNSGLDVDGEFGDKTRSAVCQFQLNNKLNTTGIYDKKTYSKMKKLIK